MKRTWLLAFLFLTLWQMLPHEGYNMLYAQGMGDESYGGGYDCKDDLGPYSSSLPCDQTPCVTPCPACHVTYACDEIDNHTCPADNITCSSCGESMTPEQYLNHTCSNQNEEERCAICGRTIDQCSCEGPVITPNNPSVPPSNPFSGWETHTGGGSGNNSNTQGSSENNPDEGIFDDVEDSTEIGNNGYNEFGLRYSKEQMDIMKRLGQIECLPNLPKDIPIQLFANECVVDATAFMANIETGEDFDSIRFELLDKCMKLGYDITGEHGLPEELVFTIISSVMDNVIQKPFSSNTIEDNLSSNHSVLALVSTNEYLYDNHVMENPQATEIFHMVTIVGYDAFYYYCNVGDNSYTAILKTRFDNKKNIYISK